MAAAETSPARGRLLIWLAVLVALGVGGYFGWRWLNRPPPPDMVAVLAANSRGVGRMEQYDYPRALAAFEEVAKLAPDWMPGKINLAIALMNETSQPANLKRAADHFQAILREDPQSPHAHYCLGIIFRFQKAGDAVSHFEAVTRIDPADPGGWFNLGLMLEDEAQAERRFACFQKALELDPYLTGALNELQLAYRRRGDDKEADRLLERFQGLERTKVWFDRYRIVYTEMGRYADVLGGPQLAPAFLPAPVPVFRKHDKFQVKLAGGARWATAADLGAGPLGDLRRKLRERFGNTMVVLDYNRDGRPDVFMLGAVVEAGQVRDLLLRNDGDGVFTDVTRAVGLAQPRPSLGCTVGDFDNDGYPDLCITGAGKQWLFRSFGLPLAGRLRWFEDVTARAGLGDLTGVCLGATFIDLDQDGDLDLVVAQYASSVDEALALLSGQAPASKGPGFAVLLNVGEAPARAPSFDPPPLKPRFRRVQPADHKGSMAALLGPQVPAVGMVASDVDHDHDLDLLALTEAGTPALVLNDRLLAFRRVPLPAALAPAPTKGAPWNGGLVLDQDRDGHSDLLLIGPGKPPLLLLNRAKRGENDVGKWFTQGATNSPPLLQAQAIDLDLDGATDVVGLSAERKPVILQNEVSRLAHRVNALSDKDWPADLAALVAADFDGDGLPDLLAWSEKGGLSLYANQGNGNKGVQLLLSGHRRAESEGNYVRCNVDGFGTRVSVHAGDHWAGGEITTLSAGLGQSLQPLFLGLRRHAQAEVVRLRWPDNCWQAEFNIPAGQVARIEEHNRKIDSCPLLFAWDGRRFDFVCDFLGAGAMGEALPDGGHRPPRPEESLKIEAGQLAPRDGHYLLKVAEPGDEVTYLDRLSLVVVDHPADVRVYPDERFTDPPPSQDLLVFRDEIHPRQARDHRGRDVTAALRHRDRDTVNGFARRTWLGLAEEHWVELDFGDRLAKFGPRDRLVLCAVGWTDYPYPESIWAADQAGVAMLPPVLERLGEDGKWHTVAADAGFPAGLPRLTTLEVTGKLGGPRCVLRLRTNMHVFWDQVFVAPLLERVHSSVRPGPVSGKGVRVTILPVRGAALAARGCVQEFSPDGKQPAIYDHDRIERVPVSRLAGRLTRFGDVTELLQERDDRFVIFGPGEEVTVRFDARGLPPLKEGWTRSFVLRTWGYSKSSGPFVATGDTVEPLPFHGMSRFPYGPGEHYPRTALHEEYQRRYNTRRVGPSR